jgi:hypothetical protein
MGDSGVGKSQIFERFVDKKYTGKPGSEAYNQDITSKRVPGYIRGKEVNIRLSDIKNVSLVRMGG